MVWKGWSRTSLLTMALCLGLTLMVVAQGGHKLLTEAMIQQVQQLFGEKGRQALVTWAEYVVLQREDYNQKTEIKTLKRINGFFNERLAFVSDETHWKMQDYWATPLESLATQGGDCEDYVIAKYFSLIQAGIPQQKLRITYVKALKLNQAHMVLSYYSKPRSEPLILDNINPKILPASRRRDLSPVYSFNGIGMWIERQSGRSVKVGTASRLSMWMDVLLRMQQQGLQPWIDLPDSRSNSLTK